MIFGKKTESARLGGAGDAELDNADNADNVRYLPQRPRRAPDDDGPPPRKPSTSADAPPLRRRVAPHEVDGFVPFPLQEHGKWRTEYCRAAAVGKVAFTSRDDELQIHEAQDPTVVLAALKVAAEQWGKVSVIDGSAKFRSLCAHLAIQHGIEMMGSPEFDALKQGRERMRDAQGDMPAPGM